MQSHGANALNSHSPETTTRAEAVEPVVGTGIADESGIAESGLFVTIREFEGPLALLLSLVRQHKMDIYDIPIADITKQYLNYLNETLVHTLDDLTSFYRMAAWLLHIKSHMLLPVDTTMDDAEIDDPRAELVQTLIEYTRFKQLSYLLENKHAEYSHDTIARSGEFEPIFEIPREEMWKEVDSLKLLATFMDIVSKNKISDMERVIDLDEPVTVREKITLLIEILDNKEQCSFDDIVAGGGLMSLVCAFLAVLELIKQQSIKVLQNTLHGNIMIHRRQEVMPHADTVEDEFDKNPDDTQSDMGEKKQ